MRDEIKTRRCSKCGLEKTLDCFNKEKKVKSGLKSICKDCWKLYQDQPERKLAKRRHRVSLNDRYRHYRKSDAAKKHGFDLTERQFDELTSQPCHYCSGYTRCIDDVVDKPYCGLDRIDSLRGYFIDNVWPACHRCNAAKNNLSLLDFALHIEKIYNFWAKGFIKIMKLKKVLK